ncbi:MAG: DUF2442 domain-containing protein [Vulcanimicrobiota bacterium]
MIHQILDITYLSEYRLILTFSDGSRREVDLEPLLEGSLFGDLKSQEKFRQVVLDKEFGSIEWPNGADICPDLLYQMSKEIAANSEATGG